MASSGIKNWHWRTKSVEPWAKEWWKKELTGVEASGVSISEVKDVEGDAELGMRKSKLVTIYDQKITMTWRAEDSEGTEVKGTLVALEVSHDMDEDEYVFQSTLDTGTGQEAEAFNKVAKKALADKLRRKFPAFAPAMIEVHGKDLLADDGVDDSASASGASTPSAPASKATPASVAQTVQKPVGADGKATFNTAIVKADAEFACTADDLFNFLTDETKIPLWSRNPAKMKPEVGAEMSMFGGNIAGKVTAVSRPDSITCDWRAPTWPEGYYGSLEMKLQQGSNSTTLNLRLSGVPVGKEDETERNLGIFYLAALKSIGSGLSSSFFPSQLSPLPEKRSPSLPPPSRWSLILTTAVPMTISLGLIGGLLAVFYYGPSGPGGD
ncbi:activator of Hsp90 ATPase protein 1, partial [Phenoliferia sp. Uapishka_3]